MRFNETSVEININGDYKILKNRIVKTDIYPIINNVIAYIINDKSNMFVHSLVVSKGNNGILIIGEFGQGKSTLGNMIKDEFNQYNIIHADSIIWGIIRGTGKEEYYTKNVKARKELVHSDKFQKIILEIYKSSIKQDTKNYGTILESGQLEPKYAKELLDMGNLICVCL